MAGVKGQPGTKPSAVKSPVANSELKAVASDTMDVASGVAEDIEWEINDGTEETALEGAPPEVDQLEETNFGEEPGFIDANIQQFNPDSFVTRVQAGLAANDTEKLNFLARKYGPGNVAMKNDKIYFRKNEGEKLKPLDPATFELISDILPDFAREIVTEGAMLPGEVAGGILASTAGPEMTVPGVIMGRVASVPMANSVADGVAELAGVHGDEARNRRAENAIGMIAEGVLPALGAKAVKAVAKRIPGTMAYKESLKAGEREIVALTRQSQEVLQAADDLAKQGSGVELMPHQIHNTAPQLEAKVADIERRPEFIKKQQEFAQGYGEVLENTVNEMKRSANPSGAKVSSEALTDAVRAADKLEGERIGMYKAKALAKTKNAPAPLPPAANALAEDSMRKMGFIPKTTRSEVLARPTTIEGASRRGIEARKVVEKTKWNPPTNMEDVAGTFGLDASQARVMVNALNKYGEAMSTRNGSARLTEVEDLVNYLGPITQKLRGTEGGRVITQITAQLRQQRRQMIEAGLPDTDKKLFNEAMDEFGLKRQVMDDLSGVLDREVSAKAIVNHFFTGGAAPERINALKTVIGTDSPQWGALKEEFLNQFLLNGAALKSATGFKSGAMLGELKKKYGENFVREVLDTGTGPNVSTLKNLLTVGERIEATQRGMKVNDMTEKQTKAAAEAGIGYILASPYRVIKGSVSMLKNALKGKDAAFAEVLNRDGVEKYLSSYKGSKNKQAAAKHIEAWLGEWNAMRAADTRVNQVLDAGKDVAKRGTRAYVREYTETGR